MRITISKNYREKLSKNLVIATGIDRCLFVYKKNDWKEIKNDLRKVENESKSKDVSKFVKLFVESAKKVKIQKDSRINIPYPLLDYAGIKKEIVFLKLGKHLEIWAKEVFEKYQCKYLTDKGDNDRRALRNKEVSIHQKAF